MNLIHLFVTGFGRPDLLREQARLLDKNLLDSYVLTVVDNTENEYVAADMRVACEELFISYYQVASKKHEHPDALTRAAELARQWDADYIGFLDHDIFPVAPTTLIDKIDQAGFFGLGQTYKTRAGFETHRYLWPGWCFFKRDWLAGRTPNFYGIRGAFEWDDGDAGSELHSLFADEDWERMPALTHGYEEIRPRDSFGLQSYGYEIIDGAWLHLTNAAHWKQVPQPQERDRLFREMLATL